MGRRVALFVRRRVAAQWRERAAPLLLLVYVRQVLRFSLGAACRRRPSAVSGTGDGSFFGDS